MKFKLYGLLLVLYVTIALAIAGLLHLVKGDLHAYESIDPAAKKHMDEVFRQSVENDLINLEIRQRKADILKTISEAMKTPDTRTTINHNIQSGSE
jgi:hypothetical protein